MDEQTVHSGKQNASTGSRHTRTALTCTFCRRRFARKEHLTRHIRIHTQEKPFTCGTCQKEFSRRDMLTRHEELHTLTRPLNTTALSKRACLQCATSRIRCNRESPCGRCDSKGYRCVYRDSPTERRGEAQGKDSECRYEVDPIFSPDTTTTIDMPTLADSFDQATALVSEHSVQDSLAPGAMLNSTDQSEMALDTNIPLNPVVYEPSFRQIFTPEFQSGINWLSPDQAILEEWGTQLAEITDNDFFPPMFNIVDIPGITNFVSIENQPPVDSTVPAQPFLDNQQAASWVDGEGQSGIGEPNTPEVPLDGLSAGTSGSAESRYYIHGVASRAPFQRRSRFVQQGQQAPTLGLSIPVNTTGDLPSSITQWLTPEMYSGIVSAMQSETNMQPQIPPLEYFRLCVYLYFDRLHPNFPFINRAALLKANPHWVLLIAIAGAGAAYLQSPLARQWKSSLMDIVGIGLSTHLSHHQVLLHDCCSAQPFGMHVQIELEDEVMPLIQAKILRMLFLLHSSSAYIARQVFFERAELTQWSSHIDQVSTLLPNPTSIKGDEEVQLWIKAQSRLRAQFMIWILDSMASYQLNCKHNMRLSDAAKWLPCHEVAWEQPLIANIEYAQRHSVSFVDAIDMVYIEKRLPDCHVSEFSHIILTHAIYRRTIEASEESLMRISSWSPTFNRQSSATEPVADQKWPPSNTTASNWRNAACDSLDVLNWAANSKAAESCWEEATICYLHLSRLIILAPVAHFQTLAKFPSLPTSSLNQKCYEDARSQVLQWAIRDQFKARLSVVHAGALLWHVRRFSTDNVIEPFGIYTATLLLWAYSASTCAANGANGSLGAERDSRDDLDPDDSDDEPLWLRLDRPLDDELVQTYIRVGNKMSAHLKGVGDLSKGDAPLKILKQGYYLLTGSKYLVNNDQNGPGETKHCTWEIRRSYAAVIRCLLSVTAAS